MTADNIPCKCIVTLATLALAFALFVIPKGPAYAADLVVYEIDAEITPIDTVQPVDGEQLRRLLSKDDLTPDEQAELDRVIEDTLEEFA